MGGGLNEALLNWLETHLATGTRLVANAVTLETEALLVAAAARRGGHLLKVELSEAQPLGRFRGLEGGLSGRSMERHAVRVAGFGFRSEAGLESLLAAFEAAGGGDIDRIATVAGKAEGLSALADQLALPIEPVAVETLEAQKTLTRSKASLAAWGTGSVAEASALAAAGPGARLLGPRVVSPDGKATCAIAEGN